MKNPLGQVDSVLLLGGRSDIGLAIVDELVDRGASRVVLAARGGADPSLVRVPGRSPVEVTGVDFDADDVESHAALIDQAADRLGDLDVVICAFAVQDNQAVYDKDPARAARSVMTNFGAYVSVCLASAERMRAQGHGTLIVMSSIAGVRVRPINLVYGAAKAGVDAFATTLSQMLVGTGVNVMIVRPGFVATKLTTEHDRAPFATTPGAVAKRVVDGLATNRRVVWAPSVIQAVGTAFRLMPEPLWRRVSTSR